MRRLPSRFSTLSAFARATLLEAWRGKLLLVALVLVLGCWAAGRFAGGVAMGEAGTTQAVVMAALLRLGLVLLLAAFALASVVREEQDRVLDVWLALPLPRAIWLCGRMAGLVGVAAGLALLAGLGVALLGGATGGAAGSAGSAGDWQSHAAWTGSLLLELTLVAALALCCAVAWRRIDLGLLAVGAAYLLARTMTTIQLVATSANAVPEGSSRFTGWAQTAIDALAHLVPRLDSFAPSAWLAYGLPQGSAAVLGGQLLQTLAFGAVLLGIALVDLQRRSL